ncbi:MAG: YraN family protein [Anaerolineales bacterium]|jgi:putative endonuclease
MNLGEWGEDQAATYLAENGYRLLERNVRVGPCELDLVMTHEDMIVFVEVKTRVSSAYGSPEEAVTDRKRERLQRAAWGYLERTDQLNMPWRIDVLAIVVSPGRELIRLDHYPGAFDVGLL